MHSSAICCFRQESSQPAPLHQLAHWPATAAAAAMSRQQPTHQSNALHAADHHTQRARAPQGHDQAYSPVMYSSHSSPSQQQRQHWQQPSAGLSRLAGQQNGHAHTATAADEDSGPEEGEIEEGEVLPDEAEADIPNGMGKRHDADVHMSTDHAEPLHRSAQHALAESGLDGGMRHDAMPDGGHVADASAKKRKRSVSPDTAPKEETQDTGRRQLSPQRSPLADSGMKKRKRLASLDPDPANGLGSESPARRTKSPRV